MFHHRTASIWIDQWWNPTLDPTGVQFADPIDALNGNYYLGKGQVGHPHTSLFPTPAGDLNPHMQPDAYEGYTPTLRNISFYQTLTPFSVLSYGGSLAKEHTLHLAHTQNITPGWNASFDYRLLNPEGIYTSQSALDHMLNATTNYFSSDSRLQAAGAIIWQKMSVDENGGLATDSIFTLQLQSNRAGIPVMQTGAGSVTNRLTTMARISYSLERQSETYRHRDSLVVVVLSDSTTRLDTIDVVDTIPLRQPRMLNPGVIGAEVSSHRDKRVYSDSTQWIEHSATLFWTNDAYPAHRFRNPLRITLGIRPHWIQAAIEGDTMQLQTFADPFARAALALGKATLTLDAEMRTAFSSIGQANRKAGAELHFPFDSLGNTFATLSTSWETRTPDARLIHEATSTPRDIESQIYTLRFVHGEIIDLHLRATHASHATWIDSVRTVHEGTTAYWLLQASLLARLQFGPIHLDMQQLLQHSTNAAQMPVPLWATKNSLYADFTLFHGLLRAQVGTDIRFHTTYHAPLYDPQTGLFLHQDNIDIGGYVWADVFVNIQVKRASIYLKAGHVNALWENPATYFLLPHYPGQGFGVAWGLTWCFFD